MTDACEARVAAGGGDDFSRCAPGCEHRFARSANSGGTRQHLPGRRRPFVQSDVGADVFRGVWYGTDAVAQIKVRRAGRQGARASR
jgi:hypothetical protein